MAQVIIFKNKNLGNVCVCYPTGDISIDEVLTKDCPKEAIVIDENLLPQGDNSYFFDAWELNGDEISVNLNKAKEITKDRLRVERKPQLEALDVQMLRNFSNQEMLVEIEAKKQILRDATKQVDTMTTIEELKAASLPVLE
jgi:hypothetical protein